MPGVRSARLGGAGRELDPKGEIMHGGRRSGLARELREQAIASHARQVPRPRGADAPLEDPLPDGVTRRQLLVAGGALAGTLWLGDAAVSRAAPRGNAATRAWP